VQAVVFDFDGLILDTERPYFTAWAEAWADHGCELDPAEWAVCIGTHGGFDPYEALAARVTVPLAPPDELEAACDARALELIHAETVLPGVLDWLTAAPDLGLGVAIASSAPPHWVEGHLERLGLRHHFPVVSTRDGVLPAKPAPDLYLASCAGLGVDPGDAVAVEDSPNGIAAAKAAGMFCVAVPNHMTRSLDVSAADLVVESLADLPLGQLVEARRRATS
jgi:HAD superfamily hydrolase (TIGR01509 family)